MTDRIANPWGERTPHGPGTPWPARVDCFLEDGLTPDDVDAWYRSASVLHSNGDAQDIAVKDGRIAGVRGRANDRINHGRMLDRRRGPQPPGMLAVDPRSTAVTRGADATVTARENETARTLQWLRTALNTSAPQALVVA